MGGRALIQLVAALLLFVLTACSSITETNARYFYFGTVIEIRIYSEHDPKPVLAEIEHQFAEWHQRFHAWQPSELTALNAQLQRGEWATPAADLAQLIRQSQQLAAQSDQLFNPALGKRIADWGFARDNMNAMAPAPSAIDAAHLPNMSDLVWDKEKLRSKNPDLQLDLGGIAKGYALNKVMQQLRDAGFSNAMVNIGGDIGVLGTTPTRPWQIAIQDPTNNEKALATITLGDGEMAFTSGVYARQHDSDKGKVHHIIDPRTGAPAQGNIAVTLVGRDGMLLQAACKVLLMVGEDWQHWAKRLAIDEAFVVAADGGQQISERMKEKLRDVGGR